MSEENLQKSEAIVPSFEVADSNHFDVIKKLCSFLKGMVLQLCWNLYYVVVVISSWPVDFIDISVAVETFVLSCLS